MTHWLLQHNPSRGPCAGEGDWVIRRHRSSVAAGDKVALWHSGRDGGVIAVGTVVDAPHPGPGGTVIGVTVAPHFVPRATLAADPRFRDALILRMPAGSNPFPLTALQWQAIA